MFSDYIVYVDESGDHGLANINDDYPIFVLSCCIFLKQDYCRTVVPSFIDFKFRFFGHDMVVLHSHDIRKAHGPFRILVNQTLRAAFVAELDNALANAPFTLISSVINKRSLVNRYLTPSNPYEIALRFCLERTYAFLIERHQVDRRTPLIFECRGRAEDDSLELAFRRVVQGDNRWGTLPFDLTFADKQVNSTGLQIADLVAHPIGRHELNPTQPNRAYETVSTKFRRSATGRVEGWGLKCFP